VTFLAKGEWRSKIYKSIVAKQESETKEAKINHNISGGKLTLIREGEREREEYIEKVRIRYIKI
jgi:hypothetical protein